LQLLQDKFAQSLTSMLELLLQTGCVAPTYRIDEQPTTAAVILSNPAGVFTMAMWIYIAEKNLGVM
jgi:hypothetical protein